jgi:hypothetical protein
MNVTIARCCRLTAPGLKVLPACAVTRRGKFWGWDHDGSDPKLVALQAAGDREADHDAIPATY